MYEENLEQAKRCMVTSTQTGVSSRSIRFLRSSWLKLNQELAHQGERRVLKSFACALVVLETGANDATNVRSQDESASVQGHA